MALNLSALPDYVNQNSRELITKAVVNSVTIDYLNSIGALMTGVKGPTAVQLLDAEIAVQLNTGCARTPSGDVNFTQAQVSPVKLKEEENLCAQAYEAKWMSQYLTKGQHYTELLFAEEIVANKASKIALYNEKLIWQGDKDSADASLNKLDGVIKQLTDAGVDPIDISAETDIVAQLQAIVGAADAGVLASSDFTIFLGQDKALQYQIALANKNLFKDVDSMTVLGTNIKIVGVPGLSGTGYAVAGRASHIVVGTDLVSDSENAVAQYSVETRNFYLDFLWSIGVAVVYPDEFVLASFTAVEAG